MMTHQVTPGRHYANPIRIGDRVCDVADPRHVGEVTSVFHTVWVRWENGWVSEMPHNHLRVVEPYRNPAAPFVVEVRTIGRQKLIRKEK